MVIHNLILNQESLSVLSPRELSEMCLVCSDRILSHFRDVLLHFHPAEQIRIVSFKNGLKQFLATLNGNPTNHELTPKVKIQIIKLYFTNGHHHEDHYNMDLDLISLVHAGPSALIKFMEVLYKHTFRRLSAIFQTPYKRTVLENCKARYKNIIRMLNLLSEHVRNPNAYFINLPTVITRIEMKIEVNYVPHI